MKAWPVLCMRWRHSRLGSQLWAGTEDGIFTGFRAGARARLGLGLQLELPYIQGGGGGQAGSPLGGTVILRTPRKQASAQMD